MPPISSQPSNRTHRRQLVAITIESTVARIAPVVPALEAAFRPVQITYLPGGPLGYHPQLQDPGLTMRDYRDRTMIPVGLVARAVSILEACGCRCQITDHRQLDDPQIAADAGVLSAAPDRDRPLMEILARQPQGQIVLGAKSDLAGRIAAIARLFPKARIVVALSTIAGLGRLRRQLMERLGDAVSTIRTRRRPGTARIVVSTPQSLPAITCEDGLVLVLADAAETTGQGAQESFFALRRAASREHTPRVYALLREGQRLDAAAALAIEMMAGPVIYREVPEPATVCVMMAHAPSDAVVVRHADALARKRSAIWHNQQRNRHLADLGRAAARGDVQQLRRLGLTSEAEALRLELAGPLRVVILVESAEHAGALHVHLPGWAVRSLVATPAAAEPHPSATPSGQIVTHAWADRRGLSADVIIRGDGTGDDLRIRDFPPPRPPSGQPVLVVDLVDGMDGQARAATRRRLEMYRRSGWAVYDQTAAGFGDAKQQ